MIIIPAIDIIDGQCVRLKQGDYSQTTVYHSNPVEVAQEFERLGAELIHVVDLDGAKAGTLQNLDLILKMAEALSIPIELGGGIRDFETVKKVLNSGVQRVILGTAVLHNPPWLKEAIDAFGERIIIGIDAKDGYVAVDGWLETTTVPSLTLAETMHKIGVQEIIYTDIARDGMLQGPNLEGLKMMSKAGVKLIASGGISTIEDVQKVKELEESHGVCGAIIGKALYTGAIDLAEAIEVARGVGR
ncbi:MAG: 1-(5-phosphoribosyl)-5-[(5-phosphoribosylamino)methylideneamino]imidazole-4-carboxamide isomerase [Firmicutes bacterium]|nr:1-(5-phosphoribosyl)-5-[(5-phosphoribosylamino)methylideneamino]imidazole-4-carboxamide isomerase [Bacillota bacterium]